MLKMLRIVVCIGLLLSGLLYGRPVLHAQEAAVVNSAQAVRFEQSPGFYHYVVFCKTPKEYMAQMPVAKLAPNSMEYGLCWYVDGSKTAGANGSQEVEGRLVVSEHHVRFMPNDPQAADLYVDIPREQAAVKHEAGQPGAVLEGKGVLFSFRFSKLCLTCAPGTPIPPGVASAGALDQEFGLLDDTILHFYSGWRQIYRMSSGAPAGSPSRAQEANSVASTGFTSKSELTRQNASSRPAVAATAGSTSSAGTSTTSEAPAKAAVSVVINGSRARPVKIGSGAADGLLVKKVPPDYTLEAKLVRLEGTVVLRAVIDKGGEVSEVNAVSGPPLLESAAVDAVKQWRYRPYSLNGQPVDVETTIAVVFALDGTHTVNRAQSARR